MHNPEKPTLPPQAGNLIRILRQHLPALRTQYALRTIGIFGSAARGETRADSDVDLLVTFDVVPSLFTFIELEHHLSDLLGIHVDLVMQDALKPAIGHQILQEVIAIEP